MGLAAEQREGVSMKCNCEYCRKRRAENLAALRIAFDTPHFDGWHNHIAVLLNKLGKYPVTRDAIERTAAKVLAKSE